MTIPVVSATRSSSYTELASKIKAKTARVGVVGLGYVGLPLAVEYAKAGFSVTGIDVQNSKVDSMNAGTSYIQDVPTHEVNKLVADQKLRATTDFSVISELDTINICVPTPLRKTKDPDMSYMSLQRGDCKVRRIRACWSSWNRRRTRARRTNLFCPCWRKPALQGRNDFFLCFSPERVDPGNPKFQTRNIPKVVGGITPACTEMGALFYSQALETVVPVSFDAGRRDGEAAGEHVPDDQYRTGERDGDDVRPHGHQCLGSDRRRGDQAIRIHAVLSGPGLGGHCIPIDPFYLSWKTKQAGIEARFIELAGYINGQMPHFVVDKVQNALNDRGKAASKGSHIHILGVAYKRDIDDVRESPALDIIQLLQLARRKDHILRSLRAGPQP